MDRYISTNFGINFAGRFPRKRVLRTDDGGQLIQSSRAETSEDTLYIYCNTCIFNLGRPITTIEHVFLLGTQVNYSCIDRREFHNI